MYYLEEFIHKSSLVTEIRGLQKLWMSFLKQFGTKGYRIVPVSQHMQQQTAPLCDIAQNTPQGWLEDYNQQGFHKYDPILAKEIRDPGPFTWTEALTERCSTNSQRVIDAIRGFGIKDGISMSLWFGPRTQYAVGLYIDSADILWNDSTKRILQTASYIFCARYREIDSSHNYSEDQRPELSQREGDVLRWIALGKTKQEVADLMHISTSCVKRHGENLSRKLEVNNMPSAVARAMTHGLIML